MPMPPDRGRPRRCRLPHHDDTDRISGSHGQESARHENDAKLQERCGFLTTCCADIERPCRYWIFLLYHQEVRIETAAIATRDGTIPSVPRKKTIGMLMSGAEKRAKHIDASKIGNSPHTLNQRDLSGRYQPEKHRSPPEAPRRRCVGCHQK